MILNYQKIELLEKTVFERVIFKPPLKATEIMENEAPEAEVSLVLPGLLYLARIMF